MYAMTKDCQTAANGYARLSAAAIFALPQYFVMLSLYLDDHFGFATIAYPIFAALLGAWWCPLRRRGIGFAAFVGFAIALLSYLLPSLLVAPFDGGQTFGASFCLFFLTCWIVVPVNVLSAIMLQKIKTSSLQ